MHVYATISSLNLRKITNNFQFKLFDHWLVHGRPAADLQLSSVYHTPVVGLHRYVGSMWYLGLKKKLFVSCNPTLTNFYSKKSQP